MKGFLSCLALLFCHAMNYFRRQSIRPLYICSVFALFAFAACDFIEGSTTVAAEPIVIYDAGAAVDVSAPLSTVAPAAAGPAEPSESSPTVAATEPTAEPEPPPSTPAPVAETPAPLETEPVDDTPPEPEPTFADVPLNLSETVQNPYPSTFQRDLGYDLSTLSNESTGWYYNRNSDHQPPTAQRVFDIRAYDAHYLGNINQPTLYLTFDQGYENGFTSEILDILRDKNVQAAFFLTRTYIRDNVDLCKRMAAEGHVVANHSWRHKSFPTLMDEEIEEELNETTRYFYEMTGHTMDPFFRPPEGTYSPRTLALTQMWGYTTVFWSLTHVDWLVDAQPGKDVAYQRVMDNLHNGAVILLHAVSESNTQALPDIIDSARGRGYSFESLWELRR